MALEAHTWEQVEELAKLFEKRFGFEAVWYGCADEVYGMLEDSLKTGVPRFEPFDPEKMVF